MEALQTKEEKLQRRLHRERDELRALERELEAKRASMSKTEAELRACAGEMDRLAAEGRRKPPAEPARAAAAPPSPRGKKAEGTSPPVVESRARASSAGSSPSLLGSPRSPGQRQILWERKVKDDKLEIAALAKQAKVAHTDAESIEAELLAKQAAREATVARQRGAKERIKQLGGALEAEQDAHDQETWRDTAAQYREARALSSRDSRGRLILHRPDFTRTDAQQTELERALREANVELREIDHVLREEQAEVAELEVVVRSARATAEHASLLLNTKRAETRLDANELASRRADAKAEAERQREDDEAERRLLARVSHDKALDEHVLRMARQQKLEEEQRWHKALHG